MTNFTWKAAGGTQTIKIDDRRSVWLAEDDEVAIDGRTFKVLGIESAVVLLEELPPVTTQASAKEAKASAKADAAAAKAAKDDNDDRSTRSHFSPFTAPPVKPTTTHGRGR